MEKTILKKSIITKLDKPMELSILLGGFLLLNSIKLSVFNFIIMYNKTFGALSYKLMFTLFLCFIVFYFVLKIRTRFVLIGLYLAQSIYMFAYLSYFSYFHSYLHLFQATALLTESVGPIMHLSVPINIYMLIILLDLPLFIAFVINYPRIKALKEFFKNPMKYAVISSLFLILCLEAINFHDNTSIFQLGNNFFTKEPIIIQKYGTVVNNISDVVFNYGGKNIIKSFKYGKEISTPSKTYPKPNFISIQVESMDANIINKKYGEKYITPYLHSLTEESIYYPYTMSYHKAGGTSDSEFSVLNSIEPLSDFPSIKIAKYNYPNSFIKRLNAENYYTMAFHGNKASFYSRGTAFSKMGFKEFNDIKKMNFSDVGWGAPDNEVFNYALKEMKTKRTPFFSYIITMSSHMPFTSVSNYYHNSNYDNIQEDTVRNYFNSMSYVDNSLKSFIEQIIKSIPNTYIFIWGDHTPDIITEEYKQASFNAENKYFEFVPMFVLTPDKKIYKENTIAASFLDVAPTILDASGIKFSITSDGMDLISPPSVIPDIPFKESLYDRKKLFNEIKANNN